MRIKEDFLQAETREGFFIRPMMKRIWACQLDILGQVDAVCKKYDIPYYASSGTLLGAVRHRGYIPWDNDIDIEMMRSDFEKFMKHKEDLAKGGLVILNDRDADVIERGIHVVNNTVICVDDAWIARWYGCPYIVGIDIFVLDNVPDDPAECDQWEVFLEISVHLTYSLTPEQQYEDIPEEIQKTLDQFCDTLGFQLDKQRAIQPQMFQLCDYIAAMYMDDPTQKICIAEFKQTKFLREWYRSSIQMEFEDIQIPVPCGYEEVLSAQYGRDWRTPVRFAASHPYPGYTVQEDVLIREFKKNGWEIPDSFDIDEDKL